MSSPGFTRMTGGSSRPLNENAAFPVFGALIADRTIGERASGGFERSGDVEVWCEAVKACAAICILPSMAMHITHAKEIVRIIEVRLEIIPLSPPAHPPIESTYKHEACHLISPLEALTVKDHEVSAHLNCRGTTDICRRADI